MNRDEIFNQAVTRAIEKDYAATRAILRNVLYIYPEDIDALLLYSIVAENNLSSIEILKEILLLEPNHEIAFAQLAKLRFAPPSSVPPPISPRPLSYPSVKPSPKKVVKINKNTDVSTDIIREKDKKKKEGGDPILIGLLTLIALSFLCAFLAGIRAIYLLFNTGI